MKNESEAWKQLNDKAVKNLRTGFADDVLRASRGPSTQAWTQLQDAGAERLRPGFADRVLRAIRIAMPTPSLNSQVALAAATAALCFGAVIYLHDRNVRLQDSQSIAAWSQFAAQMRDQSYSP